MGTEFWTKVIVFASGAVVLALFAWQYFMKPMREQQQYRVRHDEMKRSFKTVCGFEEPSDDAVSLNMGNVGEKRQKLVAADVDRAVQNYKAKYDEAFAALYEFEESRGVNIADPVARLERHEELLEAERATRNGYSQVLAVVQYFGYCKVDTKARVANIKAA